MLYVSLCSIDANQAFIQDDFNPEDIPFRTLPTMSEAVLKTMLPDKEGKVHSANLHEGILLLYFTHFATFTIFCIFYILLIYFFVHSEGW